MPLVPTICAMTGDVGGSRGWGVTFSYSKRRRHMETCGPS